MGVYRIMECPVHQVPFTKYEKDGKSWFAHKDNNGWCNQAKLVKQGVLPTTEVPKTANTNGNAQTPDWNSIKEKEQQAMYKMAALKASSQLLAAEISRPDFIMPADLFKHTEDFTNKLLKWLKEPT